MASTAATDHLFVDFERVVSYDNTVSDETKAEELYAARQTAADLPEPAASASASASESASGSATPSPSGSPSGGASGPAGDNGSGSGAPSAPSATASPSQTPADLQPRVLDDLGDEAFLDDKLNTGSSTAQQRTVTVVFRTSNVIVTIEYEEQPAAVGAVPDSKEMQDRARNLAAQLADTLGG